jgi:hypothetical protein
LKWLTGYGLDDQSSNLGSKMTLFATASDSGTHPASYTMGTGGKRLFPEHEVENSPPHTAAVKNAWSHTTTSPFITVWIMHWDNFNFTFTKHRYFSKLQRKKLHNPTIYAWFSQVAL